MAQQLSPTEQRLAIIRQQRRDSKRRAYARDPERFRQLQREYRRRHPERESARNKLRHAVRMGRIQRPATCQAAPGCTARPHAHHRDYSRPYDVIWPCSAHHGDLHGRSRPVPAPAPTAPEAGLSRSTATA